MKLTEMFNVCNECAYCPSLCGKDPEICVMEYSKVYRQQPAEEDAIEAWNRRAGEEDKHETV